MEEFLSNPSIEECADIMEVLHAICKEYNVDMSNIEDFRIKKCKERGGFEKRIILECTDDTVQN